MTSELVFELKAGAGARIQLDIVVSCHRERAAVGREGMVGNWVVEEVMDFGRSHDYHCGRRSSLLPLLLKTVKLRCGGCW